MALYTFTSQDEFAKLNRLPSLDQTQMWNTLGRSAGAQANSGSNDNFFTKRAKSIDNAIGTTGAAVAAAAKDAWENSATQNLLTDTKTSMNNIAKKYGYNSWADWQDGFQAAKDAGDTAKVSQMQEQLKEFQAQANTNSQRANEKAANYRDYMENNDVSKRINQDRGKFLGSAINTLSTATDVLGLTNGPISNAIQGGIEGIADELEENGLQNFDAQRAAQNVLVGAASGAAVGALNKGLSNSLAKRGGNLFKGGNKITQGINRLGSETTLGRIGSTVATGAGRGALSGAVGGATGAGISAALNNQDVLGSALQGATQGAKQGAFAGSVMAAGNMALNKTPLMQKVNQAQQDWQNSGDSFNERLANTYSNDDGKLVNTRLGQKVGDWIDDRYTNRINDGAKARLADALTQSIANEAQGGISGDTKFVRLTDDRIKDINILREAQGFAPLDNRQVVAYENALNKNLINRVKEGMTVDDVVNMAYESLMSPNAEPLPGNDGTTNTMMVAPYRDRFNSSIIDNFEGTTSLKSIEPRSTNKVNTQRALKNDLLGQPGSPLAANQEGGVTQTSSLEGSTSLGEATPLRTRTSIVPRNEQNVNTPDTEVYRTLTGETRQKPFLAYGESDLANRTRRGMVADSLERLGNTLEGAQTNVTRAAAKDLGIESTGKVVDNVRRKTGIANLETQAKIAKELTGGGNSLMDNVQRQALTASENGQPYKIDTTELSNDIRGIVNKYADANIFGSENAMEKFISNLRRDVSNLDSDVLDISNRMKATAADLRGKGVGEVPAKDKAQAKIYAEVANRLDDLSYKAIPQENVEAMFDATISEMRGRATQAQQNGNKDIANAYAKLADNLDSQPRTIKAFRSFKKDFVDASKVADLTALAENGAAVQMGRGFGSGIKRFTGTLLQRPVNAGLAKIGAGVNNIADRISGDATPKAPTAGSTDNTVIDTVYNPATQVYNAIGRTEGLTNGEQARTANYLSDAVQGASADSLESLVAPSNTEATSVYNSVYGTPTTTAKPVITSNSYFPTTGDYWTDILGVAMTSAINADDATAFGTLYSMYQDALSNLQKNSSTSSSDVKLTDKQRQANAAARALDDFEQAENNFAYDVSDIPILGGIANLGGNDYASKAEALALQIGYMLSGATVNKEEAKNIGMAYVPQPRENETVRRNKLAQLRGIISDYQKTYAD